MLLYADNLLKKFLDKNSENGGVNMCEAIQGIHEDGIELGKIEGKIVIVCRKVKKGKSVELIADELEDTVENISPIYEAVVKCGPDKDAEEIYEYMQSVNV